MQRKAIVLAAFIGALVGALAVRLSGRGFKLPVTPDQALLEHKAMLGAAFAGWVLLTIYWEIAARDAAAAKSSESRASRGLHVFLTNAALLLELAPIRGLGRFLPASLWIMAAGLAVEAAGLLLTLWARRHLGRNWSGEISIKVEHELIPSGPYRWLRHPIYTGLLVMYLGVLLVTGERLALAGFIIVVFAYWRKIRLEEANLNVAFGTNYDAYRRETWALVPGIF